MKTILILLSLMLVSPLFASTDKPSGEALAWWVKSQGKLQGAVISTGTTDDGKYVINSWNVPGIPKPTDAEIKEIIKDYEKEPVKKSLEERVSDLEKKVGI